jgi:hypothetical protein
MVMFYDKKEYLSIREDYKRKIEAFQKRLENNDNDLLVIVSGKEGAGMSAAMLTIDEVSNEKFERAKRREMLMWQRANKNDKSLGVRPPSRK